MALAMAENTLEGKNLIPSATGQAGPIPRRPYCKPRCYEKGKRGPSRSCECKGCGGHAHSCGWNYAFEHGYLSSLPPGFRKPPPDQELLPFEEPPTPIEDADQP
jgi:hypothetical protein